MERLRRRHAEELLAVVKEEMSKEKVRCSIVASEKSKQRRKTMEETFDKERAHVSVLLLPSVSCTRRDRGPRLHVCARLRYLMSV